MINLLVYKYVINIFSGSLVNEKLSVFVTTGFICITKYVKHVVLINRSWISPTVQNRWGLMFCLFSKNWGSVHILQKLERFVK